MSSNRVAIELVRSAMTGHKAARPAAVLARITAWLIAGFIRTELARTLSS
jgi:hypothetical protein